MTMQQVGENKDGVWRTKHERTVNNIENETYEGSCISGESTGHRRSKALPESANTVHGNGFACTVHDA